MDHLRLRKLFLVDFSIEKLTPMSGQQGDLEEAVFAIRRRLSENVSLPTRNPRRDSPREAALDRGYAGLCPFYYCELLLTQCSTLICPLTS